MADGPRIRVDLVVIATLHSLVAKEVNRLVVDPRERFFGLDVAETVCLVPTCGKDVKGDLAADRVAGLLCQHKSKCKHMNLKTSQ